VRIVTARAAASVAAQAWSSHEFDCPSCQAAKRLRSDDARCPAGRELYAACVETGREAARLGREAKLPDPGQGALFGGSPEPAVPADAPGVEVALRSETNLVSLSAASGPMTDAEKARLYKAERVIETTMASAYEKIGQALAEIRDGRLYRADFASFDDYLKERWHDKLSRRSADRFIVAAQVAAEVRPIGLSLTESQARELAPLRDEPDKLRQVASAVAERSQAAGQAVTAALITEVRDEIAPPAADPDPWGKRIKRERAETLKREREAAEVLDARSALPGPPQLTCPSAQAGYVTVRRGDTAGAPLRWPLTDAGVSKAAVVSRGIREYVNVLLEYGDMLLAFADKIDADAGHGGRDG
jgi:hypothetical protein